MHDAYTSPHWPLHAKPTDIAKYKGKYDGGWDALLTSRYNRLLQMGLIDQDQVPISKNESGRLWINETYKIWESANMEVHAAWLIAWIHGSGYR